MASKVDNRSIDEIWEEMRQHPAFMEEFDLSKPLTPAMEGLQALKYECEDKNERALNYKEDGNKNFQLKKYRWAIDNYTAGIKCMASDIELNAVLFTNRAAANSFIGNYRSAFQDCVWARRFLPQHMKAIVKGAQCLVQTSRYAEALQWCDEGLAIESSNQKLSELRIKAAEGQQAADAKQRKQDYQQRKSDKEGGDLRKALADRQIAYDDPLQPLDENYPELRMTLTAEGDSTTLTCPVVFLYPEFNQSDVVERMGEHDTFFAHLQLMFGDSPPAWNAQARYSPDQLQLFIHCDQSGALAAFPSRFTLLHLLQTLARRGHRCRGLINVLALRRDSPFLQSFVAEYDRVEALDAF